MILLRSEPPLSSNPSEKSQAVFKASFLRISWKVIVRRSLAGKLLELG